MMLAVTLVTVLIASLSTVAYGAYVKSKSVAVSSPEENFTTGAGVQGEYALDTQIAKDKSGNIWVWGYYNLCNIDNAGQGGYYGGGKNGAVYTGNASGSCGGVTINNKPSVIRGFTCATDVAGSAYALMAVDCYGNLYGWGDNTQNGSVVASDPAFIAAGGPKTNVTGGVYGLYKNQKGASEAIPNTVNQANPQASPETWKPIDGPGAPTGTYPGGDNTSKVVKVASNEYGFAWLKDDGTVWTAGANTYGARGVGKWGNTVDQWGSVGTAGYPVGNSWGVALSPTKVTFPGNVKIKAVYSGYLSYFAIDTNNQVYFWGQSYAGGAAMSNDELEAYSSSTDTSKPCRSLAGSNYYCFAPVPVPSLTKLIADNGGFTKLLGGYSYGAMLTKNKKLWTWGVSTDGVGMPESDKQNDLTYRTTPQVLSTTAVDGSTVTADNVIDANGAYHAGQFVTADGYAWAWGQHKWGGAFSSNMSPTQDALPTNDKDRPGIVWDPTKDPQHRMAVKVGGNKDGANLNLSDGSVYTWGENGGGVSLGGQGYGTTVCAYGQPGCVSPKVLATLGKRAQSGLYVWPATFVPEVQNVGSYQTVIKNAYPFQATPVHDGDEVKYTVLVRNELSNFKNPTVKIEDSWGQNGTLVPGSFSVKYTSSNSKDTDIDIADRFVLSPTGYSTTDPSMQLDPLSVIAITYRVKVSGTTGNVGGTVVLSNTDGAGGQIDSDEALNPIE